MDEVDSDTWGDLADGLAGLVSEQRGRPVTVDEVTPFGDGHSGFTFRVGLCGPEGREHRILRVSPRGARIAGPNDIGQQGRVMRAVGGYGVPVPEVLLESSLPSLDGRSFALLELVEGVAWDRQHELDDHGVLAAAVDVLARMRAVPVTESGIDPGTARDARGEVEHWGGLIHRCSDHVRAPLEAALPVLVATAPSTGEVGVLHGDFHFGNLLFRDGEIVAVLDWEIASVGDPLFDVAGLAVAALRAQYAPEPNPTGSLQVTTADIAAATGVPMETLQWYVAASCFKYAAILGYNHRLHRSGKRVDPVYDQLELTMCGLAEVATRIAA